MFQFYQDLFDSFDSCDSEGQDLEGERRGDSETPALVAERPTSSGSSWRPGRFSREARSHALHPGVDRHAFGSAVDLVRDREDGLEELALNDDAV